MDFRLKVFYSVATNLSFTKASKEKLPPLHPVHERRAGGGYPYRQQAGPIR